MVDISYIKSWIAPLDVARIDLEVKDTDFDYLAPN